MQVSDAIFRWQNLAGGEGLKGSRQLKQFVKDAFEGIECQLIGEVLGEVVDSFEGLTGKGLLPKLMGFVRLAPNFLIMVQLCHDAAQEEFNAKKSQ